MSIGPLYDATRWESGDDGMSVSEATSFLRRMARGLSDPVAEMELLWQTTSLMCEHPEGDRGLALQALNAAIPELRHSAQLDQTRVRATASVLLARLYNALGYYDLAFRIAYDMRFWLNSEAGGDGRLGTVLRSPMPTLLAEASVGVLEIYAKTLPRADIDPKTRTRCFAASRDLVESYALADPTPALYARTAQLAVAWMALLGVAEAGGVRLRHALERLLMRTPELIGVEPELATEPKSRAASLDYAARTALAA